MDVDCKNDEDNIVQSLKKGKFNILKREYLTPLEIYGILRENEVKSENKAKTIYSLSYI